MRRKCSSYWNIHPFSKSYITEYFLVISDPFQWCWWHSDIVDKIRLLSPTSEDFWTLQDYSAISDPKFRAIIFVHTSCFSMIFAFLTMWGYKKSNMFVDFLPLGVVNNYSLAWLWVLLLPFIWFCLSTIGASCLGTIICFAMVWWGFQTSS